MKVNQIVSEHKKGVRAMKYTTKTKGTVPVYGPDSKDTKLKPVKPTGTLSEVDSMGTAVKQNPDGSTVYKDATGTEKTAAAGEIKTGPDGKPTLAIAGINPGEQINITDKPVGEDGEDHHHHHTDVGGDATDSWVSEIDAPLYDGMFDDPTNPQIEALKMMLADPKYASNPMAKAQLEKRLKIALDRASLDQGQAMGAGGQPKPVLDPDAFSKANPNFKETQSAVYPSRNPGTPAADAAAQAAAQPPQQHQSVMPSRNNESLDRIRFLSGL